MRANFATVIKKRAIKNVPAFHDFSMRQIKVISNSANYPNSVTLSMDIYCDNVDGYIFNNVSTNEQYCKLMDFRTQKGLYCIDLGID